MKREPFAPSREYLIDPTAWQRARDADDRATRWLLRAAVVVFVALVAAWSQL
jgi:hypothetical protein